MADIHVWTGGSGTAPYDTWAKAATTIAVGSAAAAAGDTVKVADDHSETTAAAITVTIPTGTLASPVRIVSVNRTSGLQSNGAVIATTGASNIAFGLSAASAFHVQGIEFRVGDTGTCHLLIQPNQHCKATFVDCPVYLRSTGTGCRVELGGNTSAFGCDIEWVNPSFRFSSTSQAVNVNNGRTKMRGSANSWVHASGSVPTTFVSVQNRAMLFQCWDLDLTLLTSGKTFAAFSGVQTARVEVMKCKTGGGTLYSQLTASYGSEMFFRGVGSAANGNAIDHMAFGGNLTLSATVARTGGYLSLDGSQASWKITPTSAAKRLAPYRVPALTYWNAVTGTNVVLTLHGVIDAAAVPTDLQCWMEASYHNDAASPLGAGVTSQTTSIISTSGTSLTATTEDWNDAATARANSTAYSLGDAISLASNAGRIFFCTTAGTSSGSEPAGYASAVDGGSVTDGTAVFRAGCRFSVSVTLTTPDIAGPVDLRPFIADTTSTIYLDPRLVPST